MERNANRINNRVAFMGSLLRPRGRADDPKLNSPAPAMESFPTPRNRGVTAPRMAFPYLYPPHPKTCLNRRSQAARMESATIPTPRMTVAHAIHSGGFYGAEKVLCDLARGQAAASPYAPRLLALLDPDQTGNEVCRRAAALGLPVDHVRAKPGLSWEGLRAYASALT